MASAVALGIDPKKLVFKWDEMSGMILPEYEIRVSTWAKGRKPLTS